MKEEENSEAWSEQIAQHRSQTYRHHHRRNAKSQHEKAARLFNVFVHSLTFFFCLLLFLSHSLSGSEFRFHFVRIVKGFCWKFQNSRPQKKLNRNEAHKSKLPTKPTWNRCVLLCDAMPELLVVRLALGGNTYQANFYFSDESKCKRNMFINF